MKFRFVTTILAGLLLLTIAGCKQEAQPVLSEKTKLQLALLPEKAPIYGYANLQHLRQAELSRAFVDSVHNMLANNPALSHFRTQTGLKPYKDIHEIFFAGVLPNGKEGPKGLIVAIGKFNPHKIIDFIESKDKEKKLIKKSFLQHTFLVAEEKSFALCIPDSATLLAGQEQQVKDWLKRKADKQGSGQTALFKKIENMKYPQGFWLSMNMATVQDRLQKKDLKKLDILKKMNNFNLSFDMTNQIQFFASGDFSDAEQAGLLKDAIKGVIAAGKLSVSEERDIIDILNKINVDKDGNQVSVKFNLNKDDIHKLMEKKNKLRKQMKRTKV